MHISPLKKSNLSKLLDLIFALLYGIFIVTMIQIDLNNNSGDIGSLLKFFDTFRNLEFFIQNHTFQVHDYVFRYVVIYLHTFLNLSFLDLLKIISFTISFIIFYIFLNTYKVENRNLYLSLIIFLFFFTPNVWDLWASGIRSGIAFVIFFSSIIYLKGLKQYIAMIASIYMHLSMLPFIVLYFLFNFLENKKINFSIIIFIYVLIIFSLLLNYLAYHQAYSLATVAQSLNYQIFVSVTILVLIFINYKIFKNLYGFLAVGAGLIVIFGFLFDQSFVRYLGNFFVFYLYFLIKEGNSISIRLTCLAYFPFFCLSTYYSVINLI